MYVVAHREKTPARWHGTYLDLFREYFIIKRVFLDCFDM